MGVVGRVGPVLVLALTLTVTGCTRGTEAVPLPAPTTGMPSVAVPSSAGPSAVSPSQAPPSNPSPRTSSSHPTTPTPTSAGTTSGGPTTTSAGPGSATATGTSTTWVTAPATAGPTRPNTAATLPPPSPWATDAPTSAGPLHPGSQPSPEGWDWSTSLGNGRSAQARDAGYAAWEAMMVGCAEVDRRRWTDPAHALYLSVERAGRPGVGLVMQFADEDAARRWHEAFVAQLRACPSTPTGSAPGVTRIASAPDRWVGRRTVDGDPWAEVAVRTGAVVRLWLLQDAGELDETQLRRLAEQLAG